ncbi:uncharacterized protein MYCFIDRAFT_19570, partial [Pseudocercospora fijiensis CIRAD86]
KTYPLHCHCGTIRLTMKISPPLFPSSSSSSSEPNNQDVYPVGECNCSFCERNGYLSVHPRASNVEITRGEEAITKYKFGAKQNPHWFCKNCGSVIATDLK